MEIVQIRRDLSKKILNNTNVITYSYYYDSSDSITEQPDISHRLVDFVPIDNIITDILENNNDWRFKNNDYFFMPTGWQSWDAGWELSPKQKNPTFISFLIPTLRKYIEVPETIKSKKEILGQFIIWLRWGNSYLVLASTGTKTPPVQYRLNRKERCIATEVYANGKKWNHDEKIAEISAFIVHDYFSLKETIHALYYNSRFYSLSFLGEKPGGWESWYNHYNVIDEKLILKDLETLDKTNNFIKLAYIDQKKPVVFQIDDGWQEGLGQWNINTTRFPQGLNSLTSKIKAKGYIPGLWIAPFIIDLRTDFAKQHPDWILCNKQGKPVPAGFNPTWGASHGKYQPNWPHSYYVLDLSNNEVLKHIDNVIETAINEWGFQYLKLDFLFAGMLYGNFVNGGAAYQWYDRAVETLTKRTTNKFGEKVAYLGCGMPFESSYKYFPLSRIGADTKENWDRTDLKILQFCGRPGAYISMKDTLGHSFWNESVYLNDPDVLFFRYYNCTLTDNEKITLALVNYLFAGQLMHSDDPCNFDSNREEFITREILSFFELFKNEEFGNITLKEDIYCIFNKNKTYCGIVNLSTDSYLIAEKDLIILSGIQKPDEKKIKDAKLVSSLNMNENSKIQTLENSKHTLFKVIGTSNLIETKTGVVFSISPHSISIFEQ